MIVNYNENGWQVITQRAHGMVAAQIAMNWKGKERPKRWVETLLAIAEHDDAEVELDGENLLTETGGPLNFKMKQFDLQHCEELSMLTITKSRYTALLVSIHMDFLYRKEEQQNEQARAFLQKQRAMQEAWRLELGIDKKEIDRIYYLLEWCDAFSLLVCQGQLQPEKRGIEISTGPDGVAYQLFQTGEGKLTVEPWPFEVNTFTTNFESRQISQLKFENSAEFRKAFIDAPVTETVWRLRKRRQRLRSRPKFKTSEVSAVVQDAITITILQLGAE